MKFSYMKFSYLYSIKFTYEIFISYVKFPSVEIYHLWKFFDPYISYVKLFPYMKFLNSYMKLLIRVFNIWNFNNVQNIIIMKFSIDIFNMWNFHIWNFWNLWNFHVEKFHIWNFQFIYFMCEIFIYGKISYMKFFISNMDLKLHIWKCAFHIWNCHFICEITISYMNSYMKWHFIYEI